MGYKKDISEKSKSNQSVFGQNSGFRFGGFKKNM